MEIQTTELLERSTLPLDTVAAETSLPQVATENVEQTTLLLEVTHEAASSDIPNVPAVTSKRLIAFQENRQNPRGREMRQETAEEEEVRSILKVIATTGKFWYDWEKLRSMLSLYLMQVISEYSQAKMTMEEQKISLGETHTELAKRLDDALHSFVDGPPFTLQRLSEIMLDAQILYPDLSKLALALEKNLSVTSTLTISTDPYPSSLMTAPNGLNKVTEVPNSNLQLQSDTVMENGAPPMAYRDEIITEVETDVNGVMTKDVEPTVKPSELSPMTTDIVGSSNVLVEPMGMSK
ncbi:hypothetical protein M8C21_015279, partial [Ambrosia artemisiifolia]